MLTNLLFFALLGGTLSLLLWSGAALFENEEDPLGDRLEELQSQALVSAQRTARRKLGGRGIDRVLSVVALLGGEDWMRGSERLRHRSGIRTKDALGSYTLWTILVALLLLGGLFWRKKAALDSSMLGGVVAALILGFMLPK